MVLTKICNHRSEFDWHLIYWINTTTISTKDWPTWLSIALPGRPHPFIIRLLRGPMWPSSLSMVPIQWWLWGGGVRFLSPGIPRWDRNLHRFSEFVNCDIFSLRNWYHLLVIVHSTTKAYKISWQYRSTKIFFSNNALKIPNQSMKFGNSVKIVHTLFYINCNLVCTAWKIMLINDYM